MSKGRLRSCAIICLEPMASSAARAFFGSFAQTRSYDSRIMLFTLHAQCVFALDRDPLRPRQISRGAIPGRSTQSLNFSGAHLIVRIFSDGSKAVIANTLPPTLKTRWSPHGYSPSRSETISNTVAATRARSHDLFPHCIPVHCPPLPITFHRHAARDRYPESEVKWTIDFFALANRIHEILHVRRPGRWRLAG